MPAPDAVINILYRVLTLKGIDNPLKTPAPGFEPGIPEEPVLTRPYGQFETGAIPDYATLAMCSVPGAHRE